MKKVILISAAIMVATNLSFSQGTAINKTGAAAHNSALLDLSDTTKGILIPRMTKVNKLAISSPATGLMIYQTNDTTGFWYYNGAKWMQAMGGVSGSGSGNHYVGELYGGGIVYYVDHTGQHGFICSLTDLSPGMQWTIPAYQSTIVPSPGAGSTTDGLTNTNAIVAQAGAGTNYAAGLCRAYNGGGYSDWYLPAKWELDLLYSASSIINYTLGNEYSIRYGGYWNSTEFAFNHVWYEDFNEGYTDLHNNKATGYIVRAVRRF